MLKLTLVFVGFGLIVQSLIGLAYFISSIAEKEYRASVFGGLQFAAMVGVVWCFLHLATTHFYNTKTGSAVLLGALLIGVAAAYLILKRESNPTALQGTHGYISHEAQRFDERDQVFARNRSLRPDSDQHRAYYDDHREYEKGDSIRRIKGGPLGQPGTIDKPREHPNIAATFASLSVPVHLSTTEKFSPRPFALFNGQRASLTAENASQIVKGYTQHLGADMVGITEINPLAAVTTDLPLVSDKPVDIGVEDFCRFCKKCAVSCPSGSIPIGDLFEVNGTVRWKLNAETCFNYWGKVGTDCNVCMRVCPWSHANTFPHKIIRTLIARNRLSRRVFSVIDDIFYGQKPKPKAAPKWAQLKES